MKGHFASSIILMFVGAAAGTVIGINIEKSNQVVALRRPESGEESPRERFDKLKIGDEVIVDRGTLGADYWSGDVVSLIAPNKIMMHFRYLGNEFTTIDKIVPIVGSKQ